MKSININTMYNNLINLNEKTYTPSQYDNVKIPPIIHHKPSKLLLNFIC
jgi:hypothetical protein